MISPRLINSIKYMAISLFIFVLSVCGFFYSGTYTKFLFVISGVLGLLNVIYALYPTKSNRDRSHR
ncbi:hypothetical protein SPACI_009770 [Sporomusa acidovorans DSM 3132]|uniref:Lipoprotein n=1 Tax=Sporomusa acidovorans (strain ATCC 49682 / DSM 3132 / Mol) TaxID=1123286 RepID=A0ABZ3IZ00_SPOA4|nr:hypothetical protein SPACI_37000 [Sporomusa acidovorans DSM 3132]SDE12283.1 hypothetical protein SAMN04488499_100878 [Sporomusa acidovorans]